MRQWNGPSRGMKRKQMGMRMSTLSGVFLVLLFLSVTGYVWRVEVPGLHGKFVQDAEAGSVPLSPKRILLATHTKLLWYDYEADVAEELSSGLGVYYGVFTGEVSDDGILKTVWVVTRPVEWRKGAEYLTELDAEKGTVLHRIQIHTRFTHDAVRRKNEVYICDTSTGTVAVLQYPTMQQVRELEVFTTRNHINTLAALGSNTLWVVLHNLGKSDVVKIDATTGEELGKLHGIGTKSHGFVAWGSYFVTLDSEKAGLVLVDPETRAYETVWMDTEPGIFLKGLMVVDDTAIFGASPQAPRKARDSLNLHCDVVAVDLNTRTMLWRRKVKTHGLLNIIAAPQLGESSTYEAMRTSANTEPISSRERPQSLVQHASSEMKIGGHWPSGLPFMDLNYVQTHHENSMHQLNLTTLSIAGILEMVKGFKSFTWSHDFQKDHNVALEERASNLHRFKPGVESIVFVFSNRQGTKSYLYPWFEKYRGVLMPMINEILGENCLNRIIRLQLARMKPGSQIKPHRDEGGYAEVGHRIHIPIVVPEGIRFEICKHHASACRPIGLIPGAVFEVNNRAIHRVLHHGAADRIHLILDASETPLEHHKLHTGESCAYRQGEIVCS